MYQSEVEDRTKPTFSRLSHVIPIAVFLVAVVVRVPSCFESFWLDELHSAWSVWGTIDEVMARSTAGNQTPIYYWGLWGWKQLLGESEWILRLSSVLAWALASSVVTWGIIRTRGHVIAGVVAGLVMATEKNGIFYGTELRPFATVVLLASLATYVLAQSLQHYRSTSNPRHTKLAVLVAISFVAISVQPMSLGVMGWLLVGGVLASRLLMKTTHDEDATERSNNHRSVSHRPFVLAGMAVGLIAAIPLAWLTVKVLMSAWHHRAQWIEFGQATTWTQLTTAWSWIGLLVLPALSWAIASIIARPQIRDSDSHERNKSMPGLVIGAIAMLAVGTYWVVSALEIAPVFHRRYFVASLPLMAWTCGDFLANALDCVGRWRVRSTFMKQAVAIVLVTFPLLWLVVSQGTWSRVSGGDLVLVRRGEDWRQAVRWLQSHHPPEQKVLLSPGLIESKRLLSSNQAEAARNQAYLAFPLRGPYQWPAVDVVDLTTIKIKENDILVIRTSAMAIQQSLKSSAPNAKNWRLHSFGGVQVVDLTVGGKPTPGFADAQ